MVRTEVISEALRGGEAARALAAKAEKRLEAADRALRETSADAPKYITESKGRHDELKKSSGALNTELDMLSDSLEEITAKGQRLVEQSRSNAAKMAILDQLAVALPPFVQVAEALHICDSIEDQDFLALQNTLQVLQLAKDAAHASQRPLLLRVMEDLDERAAETSAMMTARYMDLFQVKSNSISIRKLPAVPGGGDPVETASQALQSAGLLPHAIKSIVAEIMRNDVARGIRAATVFYESKADDGTTTLEWNIGDGNSSELLEFDVDDIDGTSEADVEALTASLDVANAAARALKVFDLFRVSVLGDANAGELAVALQQWFAESILPPQGVVLSLRRSFQSTGVPKDAMRVRAVATTAAAKIVELALRKRGTPEFDLNLDTDALERTVGAECRASALLAARRAIATFATAEHDASQIVPTPVASPAYVPREHRTPDYFPSCLVSASAAAVVAIFRATRADARETLAGGSPGIAGALNGAAVELLRAYAQDVPVQHGEELRGSVRLRTIYYNDCMTLAHACRLSVAEEPGVPAQDLLSAAGALDATAQNAMRSIRTTAEQRLTESLGNACRNGGLGAYGTLQRFQRNHQLGLAQSGLKEVIAAFADIVATETAELAAATLCDQYLTKLCDAVVALPEISAEGCEQIDKILADAHGNVEEDMALVKGMADLRGEGPAPPPVERLRSTKMRLCAYQEILGGRMEALVTSFREGKYQGLVGRDAMEHFLVAIFEDTPLRAGFIRDLDLSLEAESGEWDNSNW